MAIVLNDNIRVNAGKPSEAKYLNSINLPYSGVSEVNNEIDISERHIGLTVRVNKDEYHYYTGTSNSDLVLKTPNVTGERIEKEFIQNSHGFIVGDTIVYSGGTFIKAIADGSQYNILGNQNSINVGLITEVIDVNRFVITFNGYIDNFTPTGYTVTPNTLHYISETNAGELTVIEPLTGNTTSIPIYYPISSSSGFILQYRPLVSGGTFTANYSGITQIYNIGSGVQIFDPLITGGTNLALRSIAGSGNTTVNLVGDTIFISNTGSTDINNVGDGEGLIFSGTSGDTSLLRTIKAGQGMNVSTTGDTILLEVTGSSTTLGDARDFDYTDGLFSFTPSTPIGWAVDDINEFLALLAPELAPNLDQINNTTGTFYNGNLSFGVDNSLVGVANVTTAAGNSAVNVNETYSASGTRLGITKSSFILGVLNDDITGGTGNIPYANNAFGRATSGELELELNGVLVNTLNLTSTTGSTSSNVGNTTLNVSAVSYAKFNNGNDFIGGPYRVGTYIINSAAMRQGFNYLRITHGAVSPTSVTNYLEWVYSSGNTGITIINEQLVNLNLSGSVFLSGVEYNTSGNVDFIATGTSVYKNVYSSESNAVTFTTSNLLNTPANITITGNGVVNGNSQTLPDLDISVSDPQDENIAIDANFLINSNTLLGNDTIECSMSIDHPFPDEEATSTILSETGFLLFNVTSTSNDNTERFSSETYRLEARDYTIETYANINSGVYDWDSTINILIGSSSYNNGLLVFNGELLYPNNPYLNSEYGISGATSAGNFGGLANSPIGNPDYDLASGERVYYRKFISNNTTTQSTITFEILHTGNASNFLTNGGTGGTSVGNNVKVEFLIKRSGGQTHGWANPFASTGNPEGISNLSTSHASGVTTVQATLSTTPRIANGDIVIMRLITSEDWTNRISNIEITNI